MNYGNIHPSIILGYCAEVGYKTHILGAYNPSIKESYFAHAGFLLSGGNSAVEYNEYTLQTSQVVSIPSNSVQAVFSWVQQGFEGSL